MNEGTAFDQSRDAIVLFGGSYPAAVDPVPLSETWEWTAGDWTRLHPGISPSARNSPAMTFVPGSGVLLYGGAGVADSSHSFSGEGARVNVAVDTWKWDGVAWTELHPVHTPLLWMPAMAYDRVRHQVVLYGIAEAGNGLSASTEWQTWTWDGNDWSLHAGSTASPNPGRWVTGTIAFDQAVGEVTLFGGMTDNVPFDETEVWGWDGGSWTSLPASRVPAAAAAACSKDSTGTTVCFHGVTFTSEPDSGRVVMYAKDWQSASTTWEWNGVGWANVTAQVQPQVMIETQLFPDPSEHRSVLFGATSTGNVETAPTPADSWFEVWSWSGSTWTQLG